MESILEMGKPTFRFPALNIQFKNETKLSGPTCERF